MKLLMDPGLVKDEGVEFLNIFGQCGWKCLDLWEFEWKSYFRLLGNSGNYSEIIEKSLGNHLKISW